MSTLNTFNNISITKTISTTPNSWNTKQAHFTPKNRDLSLFDSSPYYPPWKLVKTWKWLFCEEFLSCQHHFLLTKWPLLQLLTFLDLEGRFWEFSFDPVLRGGFETVLRGGWWRIWDWIEPRLLEREVVPPVVILPPPPMGFPPHTRPPYGGGPPEKHPRPSDLGLRRPSGLPVWELLWLKTRTTSMEDLFFLYW